MKKLVPILVDGLILLVVCTTFATACNLLFRLLNRSGSKPADTLVTAVNQENLESVKKILAQQGFVDSKMKFPSLAEYQKARAAQTDVQGRTPLMWLSYVNFRDAKAVSESDAARSPIADVILACVADLNARDADGWTALMWASWSGLPQVAKKLVDAGASVSVADREGNTALTLAAARGNSEVVQLLVAKGADPKLTARNGMNAAGFAQDGMRKYPEKTDNYRLALTALGM
jgi:uncharacterized protein